MRVAICADMPGLSGVDRIEHCFPAWPAAYQHGVRMLIGDVGAAAEGALDAGAGDLVIADWHHLGRNVPQGAFPGLPIRRLWASGRPVPGPRGLGGPDAAILVGLHAGAGNAEGFLSHTCSHGMAVLLDATPIPEAVLWALALGGAGIPVAAIAGDQRATEEAAGFLPGTRAVAVKAGTSRTSAMLRPPPDAREELAEAVRTALAKLPPPLTRPFPAEGTIRYGRRSHAERAARAGVGERTGERDVTARLGSPHDLTPFLARGLLATPLGAAPSIANALLPERGGGAARIRAGAVRVLTGWAERRTARTLARERPDRYPPVAGGW